MENFEPSDYIALTAVISTFLIAIFTIFTNRKSVLEAAHKQIISPMRQKWINDLREKLAEHIAELYTLEYLIASDDSLSVLESRVVFKRVTLLRKEIELMLNPEEEDHNTLIDLLYSVLDSKTNKIIKSDSKKLLKLTKKVLKQEWNVVKKGK